MKNNIFKDSSLSFQPIISLSIEQVVRYEALSRFDYFAPYDIQERINLIENLGLAREFDRRVLWKARAILENPSFFFNKQINVNITGESASSEVFYEWLTHFVKKMKNRHLLGIEITETLPITNIQVCQEIINLLKKNDIHVYLDDIGSGYIDDLMIDILTSYEGLKIDGGLINKWGHCIQSEEKIKEISERGKRKNVTVTAEFLDTREKICNAINLGIHYAQGFKIGQPLPIPENPDLVRQRVEGIR